MKIKKILGLIVFAFACVLALASCGKSGNFQIEQYGKTYSGDLYQAQNNGICVLISESDSRIYIISYTSAEVEGHLLIEEYKYEKKDNNTYKLNSSNGIYYVLINNGQELLGISTGSTWLYIKTDHINFTLEE